MAGAILGAVAVVSLAVGFIASSIWPIYLSIGCTLLSPPLLIIGVAFIATQRS